MHKLSLLLLALLVQYFTSWAQRTDPAEKADKDLGIEAKPVRNIEEKYARITKLIEQQNIALLQRMQRQEELLAQKIGKKDSAKANAIFSGSAAIYQSLLKSQQSPVPGGTVLRQYIPSVDSIQSIFNYLSSRVTSGGAQADAINSMNGQLAIMAGRLQQSNDISEFIGNREQLLKQQLGQYGADKYLLGLNKTVYYYQQQLQGYKSILRDRTKLEQFIIDKVGVLPGFKRFWESNSFLAKLFPVGSPTTSAGNIVAGLPLRQRFQNLLPSGLATTDNNADPSQLLQQKAGEAQQDIGAIQTKLSQFAGPCNAGSSAAIPDFVPDQQHNKPLKDRIFFAYNFQQEAATNLLPAIADLGLTVGVKISDKLVTGAGVAYKLGTGRGLEHIAFSSQGAALRSFVDTRIKGSWWLTGGFEYNYLRQFDKISALSKPDAWQKSALAGISKKYKIGRKEANIQCLYDFLATRNKSITQPLQWRIGYSL